jgi:hypothetical protein
MRTKYGEIKTIYDLFERTEEVEHKNYTVPLDPVFEQIHRKYICKLCGEEVIHNSEGFWASSMGSPLSEHLELHKQLNGLGIEFSHK